MRELAALLKGSVSFTALENNGKAGLMQIKFLYADHMSLRPNVDS